MLGLDYRILIFMISLFYLVLPLTVWLVLRLPRAPGPLMWCSGALLGGVGFALFGLRGRIPDDVSYLVGQPTLMLSALLVSQSFRHDLGRPWSWWWLVAAVLGYAGLLDLLMDLLPSALLAAFIRSLNLIATLMLSYSAWQVGRAERSRNATTIAMAYGVQAVGILMNLLSSLMGSSDLHTLQGSAINMAAYFSMIFVALTASMAYLGLALERSTCIRLALTEDVARTQMWRSRRLALVQADRERILNVLTNSLSHTMLQPMTAALLQLQMGVRSLREGTLAPQMLGVKLEQTVVEIKRAYATVDRMRVLMQPKPAQRLPIELKDLLQNVVQLIHQRALSQRTEIRLPDLAQSIQIRGDQIALTHALLQLIENSLAAVSASEIRRIDLSVQASDARLSLCIVDSGPGFPEGFISHFLSQRTTQEPSLEGVGLFVVQSIVHQHQGWLILANSPSGGASVTLHLPRLY